MNLSRVRLWIELMVIATHKNTILIKVMIGFVLRLNERFKYNLFFIAVRFRIFLALKKN